MKIHKIKNSQNDFYGVTKLSYPLDNQYYYDVQIWNKVPNQENVYSHAGFGRYCRNKREVRNYIKSLIKEQKINGKK